MLSARYDVGLNQDLPSNQFSKQVKFFHDILKNNTFLPQITVIQGAWIFLW